MQIYGKYTTDFEIYIKFDADCHQSCNFIVYVFLIDALYSRSLIPSGV